MAATITLGPDIAFPPATSVRAVLARDNETNAQNAHTPTAAIDTATVATNGTWVFDSLDYDERYYTAGFTNGAWHYVAFTTDTDPGERTATVNQMQAMVDQAMEDALNAGIATEVADQLPDAVADALSGAFTTTTAMHGQWLPREDLLGVWLATNAGGDTGEAFATWTDLAWRQNDLVGGGTMADTGQRAAVDLLSVDNDGFEVPVNTPAVFTLLVAMKVLDSGIWVSGPLLVSTDNTQTTFSGHPGGGSTVSIGPVAGDGTDGFHVYSIVADGATSRVTFDHETAEEGEMSSLLTDPVWLGPPQAVAPNADIRVLGAVMYSAALDEAAELAAIDFLTALCQTA